MTIKERLIQLAQTDFFANQWRTGKEAATVLGVRHSQYFRQQLHDLVDAGVLIREISTILGKPGYIYRLPPGVIVQGLLNFAWEAQNA